MEWNILTQTRNVRLVTKISPTEYLSVWHILGNLETAEVLRDYIASNPQMKLKWNLFDHSSHPDWGYRNEPRSQASVPPLQKNIAKHLIRSSNARTVKSAFMHHASNLETMNC